MKLTREQFAEMVNLSPRYLMSIENENKKPAFDTLCRIVRALGVNANNIFIPKQRKQKLRRGMLPGYCRNAGSMK